MKFLSVMLGAALVAVAFAADTCTISSGRKMEVFRRGHKVQKFAFMDFPCKYVAVDMVCGAQRVRVVPGNVFISPWFLMDTMWIKIADANDDTKFLEGRMASRPAAKYILDKKDSPFNKKDGTVGADYFMTFDKTSTQVIVRSKTNDWELKYGPFNPLTGKRTDMEFSFTCFDESAVFPEFPETMCGGAQKLEDYAAKAEAIGLKNGKKLFKRVRDKTVYWTLFEKMDVDQTPNPSCGLARDAFASCSEEMKPVALEKCYRILYYPMYRECVSRFTCDIMETVANCIATVCSDFDQNEPALLLDGNPENITSCQKLGEDIDFCNELPGLSYSVRDKCYKELFIPLNVTVASEGADTEA